MNDCSRVLTLLDVYLDDETSAETNVFVQQHLAHCGACARRFQLLRDHRLEVRAALRTLRAPAALHQRVQRTMPPSSTPSIAAFVRNWLVPAAATALVAWIVIPWRPAEPEAYTRMAVGEHRACALEQSGRLREVVDYGPEAWMPLLPDFDDRVRVIEGHACGYATDFTHVIVEERGGRRASILISRAAEGSERTLLPETRGEFEVTQTRTTRHRAFVVMDRDRSAALREWREPTLRRVHQFLKQMEGS
jgi:Putative zinc-finger